MDLLKQFIPMIAAVSFYLISMVCCYIYEAKLNKDLGRWPLVLFTLISLGLGFGLTIVIF